MIMDAKERRLMELDISSRETVTITLSRYERMHADIERKNKKIESLEGEIERLHEFLKGVQVPVNESVRFIGSETIHEENPVNMTHRFQAILTYEMDDAEFRKIQ